MPSPSSPHYIPEGLRIAQWNRRKASEELHHLRINGYPTWRIREMEALVGIYLNELWTWQNKKRGRK
jgi:hypothetical protein